MRRTPTLLTVTSLALLLAACAGAPTPDISGMVKLTVGRAPSTQALSTGTVGPLGLPTGGFNPGAAFLKVKITDSSGQPVTFRDGVYARDGQGDSFLTLNVLNNFGATILLPKGQYAFETIAKDGLDEQASTGTLLAYSKTGLTTIDESNNNIKLTFRSVINTAETALNFKLPTTVVSTNDLLDLRLNVRSNSVNGVAYSVPTTDYRIGQYTATNGSVESVGSKLGVAVRAVGTAQEPTISVTVPVTGLVQTGLETAEEQTVDVTFNHALNASSVSADVVAPEATISTTSTVRDAVTPVTGTASDVNGAVAEARLFDGTTLIASTEQSEQDSAVSALTFPDGNENWTAVWTPTTVGGHELTLIVSDSAGNESRIEQTVTVLNPALLGEVTVVTPSTYPDAAAYLVTLQPGESRKFLYQMGEIPQGTGGVEEYIVASSYFANPSTCNESFAVSAFDGETGAALTLPGIHAGCYYGRTMTTSDAAFSSSIIFIVTNFGSSEVIINPYFSFYSN